LLISSMNLVCLVILFSIAVTAHGFAIFGSKRGKKSPMSMESDFYKISEKDAKGAVFDFSQFKGKVVYGVNVASKCGYTASGYQLLSEAAKLDGVEVIPTPL
jgi:hypothetical protein